MVHHYFVYIITNKNRTTFYIWVTSNLLQRIEQHNSGEIDWFSKKYATSILIYYEQFDYIDKAILREKQLKKWSRSKKIELIKRSNLNMDELYFDN
jgi:putative endonuclease